MITDFQYELATPVKYHSGGEEVEGTFITFISPSKKQMKNNIALKEAFFEAVSSQEEKPSSGGSNTDEMKLAGMDIIDMMYIAGISMHSVLLSSTELFKSGVAKIDGSVGLTQPILDNISQDDLEAMTGDYMVNFTIASFLSRQVV